MKMSSSTEASSAEPSLTWVESMGGPLIAVPVSVLDGWRGCTESGMVIGDGDVPDDYDRACKVDGLAGVIAVGEEGARGLVLADQPATTCYLPEHHAFVRWLGAGSEADLIAAAKAVLTDPTIPWEECGVWETNGPVVLMDSVTAGVELDVEYPNGGGLPEQASVPIRPGRWTVRAVHASPNNDVWVGLVQLLPSAGDSFPSGQQIRRLPHQVG
ncbi:immunity 21 family protein [Streptomyces sp. NBC_00841]|uniref:Imm21 family immunity protein n=1 Tax=unclassified Streptomyces TaxID=2593676 RepID=UPI00225862B4|nr:MULTISPECIES: Imm21 family immunity protein [unclassified Streptomyces]MCX4530941.1 immunity 21 family protein [Streptomyces sp. NBC_01669]WSA03314.1 immunity 21 family protein [Streptomyces sp. NBC_00841]